jgi:hypothetical protein
MIQISWKWIHTKNICFLKYSAKHKISLCFIKHHSPTYIYIYMNKLHYSRASTPKVVSKSFNKAPINHSILFFYIFFKFKYASLDKFKIIIMSRSKMSLTQVSLWDFFFYKYLCNYVYFQKNIYLY